MMLLLILQLSTRANCSLFCNGIMDLIPFECTVEVTEVRFGPLRVTVTQWLKTSGVFLAL